MTHDVVNYDGGLTATPQQLIYPKTVEDIQNVLRDTGRFPGPVRAMGSYHSLTPCVSTKGTIVNMSHMNRILGIDLATMTLTAQSGLQIYDAAATLRRLNLQLITNVEIGNMTLGAAACCQSKDGLDGGEVNAHVTKIKWVSPSGELAEASETGLPELLRLVRSSYGLCGVVYEVTFRIKPLEAIRLTYIPRRGANAGRGRRHYRLGRGFGLLDSRQDRELSGALACCSRRRLGDGGRGDPAPPMEPYRGACRALDRSLRSEIAARPAAKCLVFRITDCLFNVAPLRRLHSRQPGQDRRLSKHTAVVQVCFHVLGLSARAMALDAKGISDVRRSTFQ